MKSLIVFSHQRWDLLFQRPQHVLTRLARRWRVLFVEEPTFDAGNPRATLRSPQNGITVMTPHTPLTAPGFHDDQIPLLSKLVGQAIARERIDDYGAWLCTPMALPLLQKLDPRVIVYDCADDLAALHMAPRQLSQRESALLRVANVVFCGGPGLYDARNERHRNVHVFPSSVDSAHFARATDSTITHAEIRSLARPRLGYCGVVDEHIDVDLLARVAHARPEWELCVVGPVTRLDAAALPHAPNLHYFGARTYDELPAFIAGWDVALLPFARDEPTRSVSATNALEYMAAQRPIVSTPITDVERLYGDVVRFGDSPEAFIACVEDALVEPDALRAARLTRMARIVAATSWDDTALAMSRLVEAAALHGLTDAARTMLDSMPAPSTTAPVTVAASASYPTACLILGAGPTGLSAAYHYGAGSVVLEREASAGGGCRSIEDTGFTFDYAGHILYSDDPYVQELYRLLLGDNVHWQDREAWVYRDGVYTRYPFPGDLHGLPPELLRECIDDAIDCARQPVAKPVDANARFGYPLRGGFQSLMDGFLPLLRGELLLRANVESVSPQLRAVTLADGRRFRYDTLISTMPLPDLVAAIGDEAPVDIRRAASELRHVSIRCVNLGVARPRVTDKHWIYFPGDTVFHRVFVQGNASPHCNPPGGFGLTCEISYSPSKPLVAVGSELTERCVRDCVAVGLLDASDALLTSNHVDMRCAYVIHDDGRAERVARIRGWLADFGIILAGRYSEWEYYDSDHAFIAGRKAAEAALRIGTRRVEAKRA
jgi:protoporphyrinogen oxidase/glycosyltransferase involved in cell wall biosynthesis